MRIAGTGTYLPGPPINLERLREIMGAYADGLDQGLRERILAETGIETRYFAIDPADPSRRETNTSMAEQAGRRALQAARWRPEDVDLLVVTTVVPDHLMPPTSTLVQEALGIVRCAEFEISANCTAPYKGLAIAAGLLRVGQYRRALLCCSQYISFLGMPPWAAPERMDTDEAQLRWIVSDGAAAVALEAAEPDAGLGLWLESTGVGDVSGMFLPLGAADPDLSSVRDRGTQHVKQNLLYALRKGMALATPALGRMLEELQVDPRTIDYFMPAVSSMQVARRLRSRWKERFGVPEHAWRLDFTRTGYLGGVGFLVGLDELLRTGELCGGQVVVSFAEESSKWMCAGAVLRWQS